MASNKYDIFKDESRFLRITADSYETEGGFHIFYKGEDLIKCATIKDFYSVVLCE